MRLHLAGAALGLSLLGPQLASAHEGAPLVLKKVDKALAKKPDSSKLLIKKADLQRTLGLHQEALETLKAVPKEPQAWLIEARTYQQMGEARKALPSLNRFLEKAPESPTALWLRARIHREIGKPAAALADYQSAMKRSQHPDLYLGAAEMMKQLGQGKQACQSLEAASHKLSEAAILLESGALCYLKLNQAQKTLELTQGILKKAQNGARWLVIQSQAQTKLGQKAEAQKSLEQALSQVQSQLEKRTAPSVLLQRAQIYLALGKKPEAVADLQEATRRAPFLKEAQKLLMQHSKGAGAAQ